MQEVFVTEKPKNHFLQKYISYYYFHDCADASVVKNYAFYPNTKNALTIYRNSNFKFINNHSISTPDTNTDFCFSYSGVQNQVRTAAMHAPFQKIGIVFQELGINHFINVPLSELTNDLVDKNFHYYTSEHLKAFEVIFEQQSLEAKVALLDEFFINEFIEFEEPLLKECIQLILNSSQKISVSSLSDTLSCNRKTLTRIFKKHLCCTTKEYIDIVQFRKALNDYLLINKDFSLTNIALQNEYYDQSQFINHFKKLTGVNPKKFFKNVAHLGNEDTFWTFK